MADEVVTQRLEFDASQALEALKEVNEAADTTAGKANLLNKKLQDYSRALGQSWKTTLAQMRELAGSGSEQFAGFNTPLGLDVTDDVFKQTEALARASAAKNNFITEDANAARAEMNFDGSVKQANVSIAEQAKKLQVLAGQLNSLKYPDQPQGRNVQGQFTAKPLGFEAQFASLTSYQEKLKLVEATISSLQKKTNLPFKDIGRELGKSFPELLKDTELVNVAVANLTKQNAGLSASFKTEAELIALVRQKLTELQAQGRLNLTGSNNDIIKNLKGVISEVSAETGAQYKDVANGLESMGVSSARANAAVKGLNKELTNGSRSAQGFSHNIDVIRTALGTLTAVGIFTFLNAIQKGFADAVKASRELEDSLFRLGNVEKILSEGGIDVSMKGLKEGIQEIKKLFPIFSQEDITQLVAQISISTKELGLTEKQIIDLSKAVAVLNVRSTEEETASQTAQKVISSLITDNARGIASLGLTFNETAMKAKGMEMGLITTKKALSDLTNEEKAQIKYQILLENTGDELSNIGDYLDTNTAKIKENSASWHDLLTTVGSIFTSFTPLLSPIIQVLVDIANNIKALIVTTKVAAIQAGLMWEAFSSTANPIERVKALKKAVLDFPKVFDEVGGVELKKLFPNPEEAPDWLKNLFGDFPGEADTATAAVNNFQSALEDLDSEKAQDAIRDLLKSLEDLQKKMAESEEDFQTKLTRFDQDTLRERGDLVEDYNLNVVQTIRQFALRRKEIEQKHRQKELEDERRFQEQMRQLREKFMYDLEDALRERDARQVLRLIDKFNMDKTALENENALRKKAADEDKKTELDRLKAEEEERLRVMAEEFAVRMQRFDEESAIKRQRMEEDHAVEMQRLKEQVDEKLKAAADKIADEYDLNEGAAQALYAMLKQYYGSDGSLAQLTAGGYQAMLDQSTGFLSQIMAVIAQYQMIMASAMAGMNFGQYTGQQWQPIQAPTYNPQSSQNPFPQHAGGFAQGGQFVATKPTTALFGENGNELVTITPLSQLGSMQGRKPLDGSDGLAGRNGQQKIVLDMNLSPDLEARVVNRAMDGTASVVERINRGKR